MSVGNSDISSEFSLRDLEEERPYQRENRDFGSRASLALEIHSSERVSSVIVNAEQSLCENV